MAGILTGLIIWAVFPGFMSYDSLHALREARAAVRGGPYPPFVSYVWRVLDGLWPGPTLMLAVQDFVLLTAVGSLCRLFGYGPAGSIVGMTAFVAVPAILGPMLVVWKDVAVSACFTAGCALIGGAQHAPTVARRKVALATALVAVFAGTAYRFNAAPAALPLMIWWVSVLRSDGIPSRRTWFAWTGAGTVLTVALFAAATVVNGYELPGLRRLAPNTSVQAFQVYDLLGMSAIEKRSVVPANVLPGDPELIGEHAARIYSDRHINLALDADRDGIFQGAARRRAASDRCGLARGCHLVSRSVPGAPLAAFSPDWSGCSVAPCSTPTHPGVDANEFGIVHVPSPATRRLVDYVLESCGAVTCRTLVCRPWAWYLAGTVATLVCLLRGSQPTRRAALALFASGVAYLAPQFVIDPAGDLRYNHWAIVAMMLCCLAAVRVLADLVSPGRRLPNARFFPIGTTRR